MTAFDYIISKQIQWANNHKIKLFGSKGNRGRLAYTKTINENLFEPLLPEVLSSFIDGDGNELSGTSDSLPKMHAVHSSSALSVNIFQYWLRIRQVPEIAYACGLCKKTNRHPENIKFESKFSISQQFRFSPNIDVVIENSSKSPFRVYAIECKFSEAYSSQGHSGIDPKYLNLERVWSDLPHLYNFAKLISPKDKIFKCLHPAQLVKHILGLKEKYGKNKFRLLYLWYDSLGDDGATHRREINDFMDIAIADRIHFHSISYQELIIKLSNEFREAHENYISYISSRYL